MDELAAVCKKAFADFEEMKKKKEQAIKDLRAILWGSESEENDNEDASQIDSSTDRPAKKRAKRLTTLNEDKENTGENEPNQSKNVSKKESLRGSLKHKTSTAGTTKTCHENEITGALKATAVPVSDCRSAVELMPPPAVPVSATVSDQSFARPQRASKLKCEKNLKEPSLNSKLRRPVDNEVQIKLEHEQRASQMHAFEAKKNSLHKTKSDASNVSTTSHDSVIVIPNKEPSIVTIAQSDESSLSNELEKSEPTKNVSTIINVTRKLSVRVKREKLSEVGTGGDEKTNLLHKTQKETTNIESSVFSTTTTLNSENTTKGKIETKKGQRKKKLVPKPIKVERLSDVYRKESDLLIASRTRTGNNKCLECDGGTSNQQIESGELNEQNNLTEKLSTTAQQKANVSAATSGTLSSATIVLESAPIDATYCATAAATFVVDSQNAQTVGGGRCDLTFDVASNAKDGAESQCSSDQSMATARDTMQNRVDSLITEDESDQEIATAKPAPPVVKLNTLPFSASKKATFPAKSYKMPVREIFNPLVQSPVKKKIEAFENVTAANKNTRTARSKLAKENSTPMSLSTTPLIGKATPTAANRYLTPTQSSNLITASMVSVTKNATASASKASGLSKSSSAGNIKIFASAKAPQREHSAEDFRRAAQQIAEERKKQRDQRHLLAAQQREAKERERAERLAKLAKEREEKRLKKQQQAEQKQRELLEIQRKLKQQEEAAAAEVAAQKEKLMKISQQSNASGSAKTRMLPPQPRSNYTFEMLHEDDSTDDEGKVTYKRPPVPNWSLTSVRGPAILAQEHMPIEPIDNLFSVQPLTLDLKTIFPEIDQRYLKRNSSAIWQTPPRYSELPKY